MADPTESVVQGQINNVVTAYIAMRGWGGTDSPNLLDMVDTIEQTIEGDYAAEITGAARALRAGFGNLLGAFRGLLDPLWQTYGKVRKFPETAPDAILSRLWTDFVDNSKSVNSRAFTFGSVSAGGSNVGSGTILRLTKDKEDLDLEAVTPDVKTFKCIKDEHSDAQEHEESFEVRGEHEDRDGIVVTGSGDGKVMRAVSAGDSDGLENPSFDVLDGSVGSLDSIPGWVPGTLTNFDLVAGAANIYRDHSGAPTTGTPPVPAGYSLKLSANDTIEQNLNQRHFKNPTIEGVLAPMHLQVAWNGTTGSAVGGNIKLTLGAKNVSVAVAQSGWQVLMLGPGDENWYDEWIEEDPKIAVNWSGRTSGYLLFDDIIFAPFIPFDGCWWLPVGGATPFQRKDSFTFTDSIAADAKVQRTIAEIYGVYLPHNGAGAETWADPT